ncbi:MAG: hypothetical protein ACJAW0_001414 [Zhongshania sp.]|jgi:hypothetical protein
MASRFYFGRLKVSVRWNIVRTHRNGAMSVGVIHSLFLCDININKTLYFLIA